mgnify:CR=1 FL=1
MKLITQKNYNEDGTFFYRVTRKRVEETEWCIESNHELSSWKLQDMCNWRESTGGNKEFPYGQVTSGVDNTKWLDVGHGPRNIDNDSQKWEVKQLTTEYELYEE